MSPLTKMPDSNERVFTYVETPPYRVLLPTSHGAQNTNNADLDGASAVIRRDLNPAAATAPAAGVRPRPRNRPSASMREREKGHAPTKSSTGSDKTLGTILRDPIVPSSVGQVELSGYSAIFSSQSAT